MMGGKPHGGSDPDLLRKLQAGLRKGKVTFEDPPIKIKGEPLSETILKNRGPY
jgi:hypothetical protein